MIETKLKVYQGNCHCGAFRFEVTLPENETITSCNCSICSKKGYLWALVSADRFRFTRGDEDALTSYEFGRKTMVHKFCPTCGTGFMIRFHPDAAHPERDLGVNVRSLLDIDPFSVKAQKFDGQSLPSGYSSPVFVGEPPDLGEEEPGLKVYTGSCHCGGITLAIKTRPLAEIKTKEDNCSICRRNANLCIYPNKSQVTVVGVENTTEYIFGKKFTGHHFCKICGVPVYMKLYGPPKALVNTWPEARQEMVKRKLDIFPLRVALLDDVELDQLKIERTDEGTEGYVISD